MLMWRSYESAAEGRYEPTLPIATNGRASVPVAASPVHEAALRRERQFRRLLAEWRSETLNMSSMDAIVTSAAYKAIIEMGMHAVPLILHELEAEPEWLFNALERITGENPVTLDRIGNIRHMSDAWVDWGKVNHFI